MFSSMDVKKNFFFFVDTFCLKIIIIENIVDREAFVALTD